MLNAVYKHLMLGLVSMSKLLDTGADVLMRAAFRVGALATEDENSIAVADTIPPNEPVTPQPSVAIIERKELPKKEVFKAMFERQYGRNGTCPIYFSNVARQFTSDELYAFISRIAELAESPAHNNEFLLYNTVITVILHPPFPTEKAQLN